MIRRSCRGSCILSSLSTAFQYAGPIRIMRSGLLPRMGLTSWGTASCQRSSSSWPFGSFSSSNIRLLGCFLIAQRDLFPEFHQAQEILDRSLVHLFVVMYVDDGGQIPRQRLPNGPIDALEEMHF